MSDEPQGVKSVEIERTLEAPIDVVWSMWTDGDHFSQWYGPPGAMISVATWDLSIGGTRHVSMTMQGPDGEMSMWFVGEHVEIDAMTKFVYTEAMSDEAGNVKSAAEMGMPDGHPMVTNVIVELEDLGAQTRMSMTHVGVPADSPGGMGWNMAIDKLVALLAEHS